MARLQVEPRPSGYIPGALPIELPSPGYKVVLPLYYHHSTIRKTPILLFVLFCTFLTFFK